MKQHITQEQLFSLPCNKISKLYCDINNLNYEKTNYNKEYFTYIKTKIDFSPYKEFIDKFIGQITIGKMIDFIFDNIIYMSSIFNKEGYDTTKSFDVEIKLNDFRYLHFSEKELCYALWDAVKSTLSEGFKIL